MSWERRLRDMLLAGGALTAVACGSSSSSSDSVPNASCCNGGGDPCCSLGCADGVGPDGASYLACEEGLTECQSMNGSYDLDADGSFACVFDAGSADTGAADAGTGPGDAGDAGNDTHD